MLVVGGAVLVGVGWLLLRPLGTGVRVGRILATTPVVSVAAARELATRGQARYVGVAGRIDADDEFEDELHRPLVFRRSRIEVRAGSAWSAVEDNRERVPFEIVDGLDRLAVDAERLDIGLVVVVREAEGTAADIPDRIGADIAPGTPVRLRVEQVSSVDHVLALGVPSPDPEHGPVLRPGLGRPLILTTLERPEAMRVLAVDHRWTTRTAAILLAAGLVLAVSGIGWWVVDALA
jgi:hypothetical protein